MYFLVGGGGEEEELKQKKRSKRREKIDLKYLRFMSVTSSFRNEIVLEVPTISGEGSPPLAQGVPSVVY